MHHIDVPDWAIARGKAMNDFPDIGPARAAMLVVDMQNAFMLPGQPVANAPTAEIIPNINRLTGAAHDAGLPVCWSRHAHTDEGPGRLPDWQRREDGLMALAADALRVGSLGHRIHADLDVRAGDLVFDKYRFSCFYNAAIDLDAELKARGIDTLIVTGTVTNCCCETTARDAAMRGYKVFFLSDATAALTDAEHNAALLNVRIAFGEVLDTDAMTAIIRQSVKVVA